MIGKDRKKEKLLEQNGGGEESGEEQKRNITVCFNRMQQCQRIGKGREKAKDEKKTGKRKWVGTRWRETDCWNRTWHGDWKIKRYQQNREMVGK